ncbi:MAG TPA: LPS assembly lipoprotein LptE [Verrucomicrobiae bacterium]|nr:LPS assembly lipoprotein LptE [Verrucomicrobiae bacterium]
MKRLAKCVFLLALSVALCGCGYHLAGHSNALPKSIHVIAVPALENKTTTYRIEQRLTAATIHELLAKTHYHVVSDPAAGDAVLRGKVVSLEVTPLVFQTTAATATTASTAQATVMLVTMKCEVTLTEQTTDKVLYHTDNFLFRNEYELATSLSPANVASFFQEGDPALDRMSRDFAQRLVAAVTENY